MNLAPRRVFNRWKARFGIRKRLQEITTEFGSVFPQFRSLELSRREGGFDSIYFLKDAAGQRFGVMRLNNPSQVRAVVYPDLPRRAPSPTERIDREWTAYSMLAPLGLSPWPLWRSSDAVVCSHSTLPSLRKVMEEGQADLTKVFTAIFNAIGKMHQAGVVHLDLSPGNILICPETFQTLLIDFEYGSRPDRTFDEDCRFDRSRVIEKSLARAEKLKREAEVAACIEAAVLASDDQRSTPAAISESAVRSAA
jgi:hypothetical protein